MFQFIEQVCVDFRLWVIYWCEIILQFVNGFEVRYIVISVCQYGENLVVQDDCCIFEVGIF